jgi:CheY-like chemotaxis protein
VHLERVGKSLLVANLALALAAGSDRLSFPVALKGSVDAVFLEANNVAEGLKSAREHRGLIDLLVSDVVMPGSMNGTEMAAQLSDAHAETQIVLMSGYAPEALTMAQNWHFIRKPFGMSENQSTNPAVIKLNSTLLPLTRVPEGKDFWEFRCRRAKNAWTVRKFQNSASS